MADNLPAPEQAEMDRLGLDRLIFFSDGIFGIAVTLLALEIRLPSSAETLSNAELLHALIAIGPKYLAYFLSFCVIGSFWVSHHRRFRYIRHADGRLMFLNLLLLMGVAFMPFPTVLISESGNATATIFYAATVAVIGILFTALWVYAAARDLISPSLSAASIRREGVRGLVTSAIFTLSIGLSVVNIDLVKLSWALLIPAWLFILH